MQEPRPVDATLLVSVLAALGGLAAGTTGAITGHPAWSVAAGALALAAGIAAAALAVRSRQHEERARDDRIRLLGLERSVHTLSALFAEEATRQNGLHHLNVEDPARELQPVDRSTGLVEASIFPVLLDHRVAAARRSLRPVSVVLFELDGYANADPELRENALGTLAAVMKRTLRESDACCRYASATTAAILDDTAEDGAMWVAERVRMTLLDRSVPGRISLSAGIASYPTHALEPDDLVRRAEEALTIARRRGHDHVEIARADGPPL